MRCLRSLALRCLLALLAALLGPPAMPAQERPGATARPAAAAPAPPVILLEDSTPDIDADGLGLAWIDTEGTASFGQAMAARDTQYRRLPPRSIHSLGNRAALWLRLRVARADTARAEWLLEIPLPYIDAVTVYQQDARGEWRPQSAGDTVAVSSWPEAGRYPVFRLSVPAGETRDIYLRIRNVTPLSMPLRLTTEAAHHHRQQVEYLGLGTVFGALLLLIMACAAQSWVYRDPAYGWYAAYAGIMTLAVAAYTGVAAHLLWSDSGTWADTAQGYLALLAGGAALVFVCALGGMAVRAPRMARWLQGLGLASPALAVAYAVMDRALALPGLGLYLGTVALLNLWVAWQVWRRGDAVGPWMLAAYLPLALSVLLALARLFGWLSASWLTQYAVVIAMVIEVPLLLVALNIRSRERHGTAIRELALSSQDPLTGLLASHLFQDRLRQAIARCRREGEAAAVVFIDLVNHGRIKDSWGPAVAEQSVLRSVIKLRRLLRDVDTTSRVGEARFGLIMEGVSSRAVVTDRAARLIAAGLMPLKGLKPDVTLQFHVAGVLLGEHLMEASELTEALDRLLGDMSARTRRPIRFLEPQATRPASLTPEDNDSEPATAAG